MSKEMSIIKDRSNSLQKEVIGASNQKIIIDSVGSVRQSFMNNGKQKEIQINNVYFIPSLCPDLLSVSPIVENDNAVLFNKRGCKIFDPDDNVIATALLTICLYSTHPKAKSR